MMSQSGRKNERGVALLVVTFALLLLAVIGLGMMYATNMETSINSNYRDKQAALYAALAGLQEARDRIQPATHNIVAPTTLPGFVASISAGSAGVIYVVADGTVDPTNSGNIYFDTEFCHENVLGMTGTSGAPCTAGPTVPSAQTYYQPFVVDSTGGAPWNLSPAFDTKWIRITLKGNNMVPAAVNGSSSTSTQVCWDGSHQILLPSGYGTSCSPNGSVSTLTLTSPGSGYTSTPTVTISAPPSGGTQATATIQLNSVTNGQVAQVQLTTGGVGYTSAPAVGFVGGGGTGAAATATVSAAGAPVQCTAANSAPCSLTLIPASPGAGTQCYLAAPSVTVSGGGGTGATATAALNTTKSCVYSWTPTASCGSPWKNTTESGINLSGGGGTNFSGTITFSSSGHSITSSSIQNSGSGYSGSLTSATTSGGSPHALTSSCAVTPNAVAGYFLQSVTLTSGGTGYTSVPSVTVGTGNGVGTLPTLSAAALGPVSPGQVLSVTMTSYGSGYTTAPTVTFTGGTGGGGTIISPATATAILGVTNTLANLTIGTAGSGYTSNPTVTIGAPGGSGVQATATATIGRGTDYGNVWLLTALAETRTGARSMAQMEVASPVLGYATGGALTLAGPSPTTSFPNSSNFGISGTDANSCGQTAQPAHPAIDGYDDPNSPTNPTAVQSITSSIPSGRQSNYTGASTAPDVENGYSSLGETMGTPTGLKSLLDALKAVASANGTLYASGASIALPGTTSSVFYVDGDFSLGPNTGNGILVVTGTLSMNGNFGWNGMVFAVGDGIVTGGGGGNGTVNGNMIIAKIWDSYTTKNLLSSLGSPTFNWAGGGGNFLQYDHCLADNLMQAIPFTPPPTTKPLKVLSFRSLPY